jgi:hypothetical protein
MHGLRSTGDMQMILIDRKLSDGYQLIINFEEEDVSYPANFTIGVDADKSFRPCGVSSIMTDY